jgi:hypothetical protein
MTGNIGKYVALTILAALAAGAAAGCQAGKSAAPPVPSGRASRPGWEIQYTAAVALARRGSDEVKNHFGVLQEMLDEQQQLINSKTKLPDGREVANEQTARSTVINALKAVAELHRRKPDMDLSELDPAIQKLTQSENPVLRNEAERTRLALATKS